MKVFIPTQFGVVKVDYADYEKFKLTGRVKSYQGCRKINVVAFHDGRMWHINRLILGLLKSKRIGDHINGNRFDNTRGNLRITTVAQNNKNKANYNKRSNLPRGVSKTGCGQKFTASITNNKKRFHLGTFTCPNLAHEAYLAKQKILHGKYRAGRF